MSSPRIDHRKASPGAALATFALGKHVAPSTRENSRYELNKIRAALVGNYAPAVKAAGLPRS